MKSGGTMRRRFGIWIAGGIWLALACNLTTGAATPAVDTPTPTARTAEEKSAPAMISPIAKTRTPFPTYERSLCVEQTTAVALLVDPGLAQAVRVNLDQFETDLCADGYQIIERSLDFSTPREIRAYLAGLYAATNQKLEGAIFIGSVPFAYQSVRAESSNPDVKTSAEEVISFQYYSDLDGEFSASPEYRSQGRHEYSFDQHTGDVDWEIWTGILPFYRGDEAQTVEALNRYFEKNHAYRTGKSSIPEVFLLIGEHFKAETAAEQGSLMEIIRSGPYSWTPLSNSAGARIYFNGLTLSIRDGYTDLSTGAADITVTETHGDQTMSGMIDIPWVESNPVRTVLFWTDGCSVGNLDYPENFLTSIVYSSSSEVLIAKGSTNDSGGLGTNQEGYYGHNIAVRLVAGKNLGQAILGHVNVPLIPPWSESREFHFSMLVLIGDPTLRLRNG
jgi:hypothetical protein